MLNLYFVMGDRAADFTAKQALQNRTSPINALAWEIGDFYAWQHRALKRYYDFYAQMDQTRMEAVDALKKQDSMVERISP